MADETINPHDAARARDAAATARRHAAQIRRTATHINKQRGDMTWTGPLAVRIRGDILKEETDLATLDLDATKLAKLLEEHAAWIDSEVRRLEAIEADVRAWLASNPEHPTAIHLLASPLPPPRNTRWDRIRVHPTVGTAAW